MRVRGVTTILVGVLGLASINSWAAQSPSNVVNESRAAGPIAVPSNDSHRVAQAGQVPATNETAPSQYAVEGLALGGRAQSVESYRAFRCGPSEQFAQFTWCNRTSAQKGPRGEVNASYSILYSTDGTIVYANRSQEPAYFSPASAKEEIQRIAQNYGVQPQIIELPHRAGLPDGLIAVWGDVVLQPVDEANLRLIAGGKSPKLGFMIDFISDFQRSAKMDLPVYRIGGGAGSVWAASFRPHGRGTLRFVAVDAAKFSSPRPNQAPVAAPAQSPQAPSQQSQSQQAPSQQAKIQQAQPQQPQPQQPQPQQAQPQQAQPQSSEKAIQPEPTVAELKQTIQTLKADMAAATAKVAALEKTSAEARGALKEVEQARLDAESAKRQSEQANIANRNQLEAANSQSRFWKILAAVATVGLIAALAALLVGWRRTGETTQQAGDFDSLVRNSHAKRQGLQAEPAKDPLPAPAALEGIDPGASEDVLGRELEKHVANINATRSEPVPDTKENAPAKTSSRPRQSDQTPIFY
jgi:hypothetical protein